MIQYDRLIDQLIDLAIEEDIATGDVTTNSIIPAHSRAVAEMKMKADGVISGLSIARRVYERFEKDIVWHPLVQDGDRVKKEILSSASKPAIAVCSWANAFH